MRVPPDRFEVLVAAALDELPEWIQERLENVDVLIDERPEDGGSTVLGLYEGIPLTRRGTHYAGVLPDRITLFRANIERSARDEQDLKAIVGHTVVHEIAHFFGISDQRLREIDRY